MERALADLAYGSQHAAEVASFLFHSIAALYAEVLASVAAMTRKPSASRHKLL